MAPSGWEVLARIEKLEVGWQRVVALFSVHTTGAYGTKRAKSVGCPHYTCQCCKPGNDGKVYWRGCRKQARKRGQPENPGCQPWGRSSPGYVVEGVSGSEKCSSSYVNSRPSYWSSLYRELRGGFWIGSHIHTRLSAELSGISVTRQGFWESMALATRKMRHGGGGHWPWTTAVSHLLVLPKGLLCSDTVQVEELILEQLASLAVEMYWLPKCFFILNLNDSSLIRSSF